MARAYTLAVKRDLSRALALSLCCLGAAQALWAAPSGAAAGQSQAQAQTPAPPPAGGASPALPDAPPSTQLYAVPTPEEAQVAQQLTQAGEAFLTAMLGPGRAKLLVNVEGERSRTHTQTEILTPIYLPGQTTTVTNNAAVSANAPPGEAAAPAAQKPDGPVDLPGYIQDVGLAPPLPGDASPQQPAAAPPAPAQQTITTPPRFDFFQKDREETLRVSGFIIKRLKVTCVLDSKLPDAKAAAAAKVLPDLFHIDTARGDEISIVRAPLMPYWKMTLQDFLQYLKQPQSMRTELRVAAVSLLIILLALALYLTASRLTRRFVDELGRLWREREAEKQAALADQTPEIGQLEGEGIPDLIEGGVAAEEGAADKPKDGEAPAAPALGQRFDFLSKKAPAEMGKLLLTESPQDLAVLFGYLTEASPEMATTMFAAMPQARQMAVSRAMAGLTMADPERLNIIENRLKAIVEFGVYGAGRLTDILSRLPLGEREALINDLMSASPQAAQEIGRNLFSFEDIGWLKPTDLRRLIMAVTYPDWGLALRGAPQEMVDRILEQLLPGTQSLIREAMETPQPRAKVLEARGKVLAQAYEMAGRGEIALTKAGSSDLV